MQLSNDFDGFSVLYNCITEFYEKNNRHIFIFETGEPDSKNSDAGYYVKFLIDRVHVIQYRIFVDRSSIVGDVSLAIGPHFFDPGNFWSYNDSERFTLVASTDGVLKNLTLMDVFFAQKIARGN